MVGEHTRESLLHLVERSITAERLVGALESVFSVASGAPDGLRMDNGPELVSQALQRFCGDKVGLSYIPPGLRGTTATSNRSTTDCVGSALTTTIGTPCFQSRVTRFSAARLDSGAAQPPGRDRCCAASPADSVVGVCMAGTSLLVNDWFRGHPTAASKSTTTRSLTGCDRQVRTKLLFASDSSSAMWGTSSISTVPSQTLARQLPHVPLKQE
jgi:hypothetical protein